MGMSVVFTRDQFSSDEKYKVIHATSNELSHSLFLCKHNCVFRGDREPSILLPEHMTQGWIQDFA